MGVGSLLVVWQLAKQNNKLDAAASERQRWAAGLVCDWETCRREERERATGAPSDVTVPLTVVNR